MSFQEIIQRTADCFGVQPADILSRRRNEPVATARKVAMVLYREQTKSLLVAAKAFRRVRGTVSHAVRFTDAKLVQSVLEGRKVDLHLVSREPHMSEVNSNPSGLDAPQGRAVFVPWNHPIRADAETMVQRYHDYAQTHLPSDNKRQLAEMFVEFLQAHLPESNGHNAPGERRPE